MKQLDQPTRRRLFKKVVDYLVKDSLGPGKPLKNNMVGVYRSRMGSSRVIYSIDLQSNTLKILDVGHRKDIY